MVIGNGPNPHHNKRAAPVQIYIFDASDWEAYSFSQLDLTENQTYHNIGTFFR